MCSRTLVYGRLSRMYCELRGTVRKTRAVWRPWSPCGAAPAGSSVSTYPKGCEHSSTYSHPVFRQSRARRRKKRDPIQNKKETKRERGGGGGGVCVRRRERERERCLFLLGFLLFVLFSRFSLFVFVFAFYQVGASSRKRCERWIDR